MYGWWQLQWWCNESGHLWKGEQCMEWMGPPWGRKEKTAGALTVTLWSSEGTAAGVFEEKEHLSSRPPSEPTRKVSKSQGDRASEVTPTLLLPLPYEQDTKNIRFHSGPPHRRSLIKKGKLLVCSVVDREVKRPNWISGIVWMWTSDPKCCSAKEKLVIPLFPAFLALFSHYMWSDLHQSFSQYWIQHLKTCRNIDNLLKSLLICPLYEKHWIFIMFWKEWL